MSGLRPGGTNSGADLFGRATADLSHQLRDHRSRTARRGTLLSVARPEPKCMRHGHGRFSQRVAPTRAPVVGGLGWGEQPCPVATGHQFLESEPDIDEEALPAYAPEWPPDEYVWSYRKHSRLHHFASTNVIDLYDR